MGKKVSEAVRADRRLRVARLLLRNVPLRAIVQFLEADGSVNPTTNKPWSLFTIHSDKAALVKEWKAEYLEVANERKAILCAELSEVRRAAWSAKDLHAILKAIKLEADLLGLAGPVLVRIDFVQRAREFSEAWGLDAATTEDVVAEVERMLREPAYRKLVGLPPNA